MSVGTKQAASFWSAAWQLGDRSVIQWHQLLVAHTAEQLASRSRPAHSGTPQRIRSVPLRERDFSPMLLEMPNGWMGSVGQIAFR